MPTSRQPISFIATPDADAARAFYSDTMGLPLMNASPYALAYRDGDTMLRIQIVAPFAPAPYTVHGWQVPDIETEIAALQAKGVTFLRYDALEQSSLGVWRTPSGDKIAWFNDPAGNILSLTEFNL